MSKIIADLRKGDHKLVWKTKPVFRRVVVVKYERECYSVY